LLLLNRYGLSGGTPNEKGLKVDAEVCGVTLEHENPTMLTLSQIGSFGVY